MNKEIVEWLTKLNADKSHSWPDEVKGQAPHKPFLLLSILDGVEQEWIPDNRIELNQPLIETFFEYWNSIMGEDRITTIALPFYHMQSEGFWELRYKGGKEKYKTSPSLGGLTDRVKHAKMNEAFFTLFDDPDERNEIRSLLITTYFSEKAATRVAKISRFNYQAYNYSMELESIAAEPFKVDHTDEAGIKYRVSKTQVRDAGFSKTVRKAYQYTCAICRSRVVTQGGSTLVDGAHIIPRSRSNNDDPRNGLALCKTHHWMFDQFMLTIQPNYKLLLSKWLKEEQNEVKSLWDLNQKPILLPYQEQLYPAQQALEIHMEKFKEAQ